ncbi:ParB/RepB/Spo0J family partition protein [Streptomyces sp. NBC_01498]|uniref:ParB/RepB/Spo0J family partition protein n=1 Tax=Streptomyces sp. NBC_01498 TaxID=2975870 RepID=UPI002E7BB3E7|nr:ParB/RepB/Spo0J family partition protein [Streptomyces sp. NBC_01498]WTL23451.1 ParB/RepB/Spo0J family partition protein [Streptomyces sp. NBC_01498]
MDRLVAVDSPRLLGVDEEHVRALAESESELPPITVHRQSMWVIDGVHRLRAALLGGQDRIAVRFFEGDRRDAYLLSVAVNVTHGLPLSRADRLAAVRRILSTRPELSDRAVASVAGLSAARVSAVRRSMIDGSPMSAVRVGLDGRVRPLNSTRGRELASQLLRANPSASLRQVARVADVSPATVADVRKRLSRGDDPVPSKLRPGGGTTGRRKPVEDPPTPGGRPLAELLPLLDSLRRDPSLRFTDTGRLVLRLFDSSTHAARARLTIMDNVPPHCRGPIAQLLLGYAEVWCEMAKALDDSPN